MESFQSVCTVNREVSKEEFLRALLLRLASYHDTPYDVCTAEFGEVQESRKEVIICSAHVETNYSASVGYDRKEEYWDKEKKYKNGTAYYVDVKKVRTVTDWTPFSGHTAGDKKTAAFNEAGESAAKQDHDRIAKILTSIKDESIQESDEQPEVSFAGLERAKSLAAEFVEHGIQFPGDHVRNSTATSTVSVKELTCYDFPYYEVEFTYKGKKYHAGGFACGSIEVDTEYPPNNVDIKRTVNQEFKPFKIANAGCWLAVVAVLIAAIVLSTKGIHWFWILLPVFLVVAIVVLAVGNKKYNARLNCLQSENLKQKQEDLQKALKAYGYDDLSAEELASFKK